MGRSDDVPVLHTVFAPLTIARKLAGDRLLGDLKDHPDAVMAALDTITETVIRYVTAVAQVGADGIFSRKSGDDTPGGTEGPPRGPRRLAPRCSVSNREDRDQGGLELTPAQRGLDDRLPAGDR